MKLQIDFSLEQPKGGVQFVIPSSSGQSPESSVSCANFTWWVLHVCSSHLYRIAGYFRRSNISYAKF